MAVLELNNENIKKKLLEINNLPEKEKSIEIDTISKDLRAYVKSNFSLTSEQITGIETPPDSLVRELGIGIGIALENNWGLVIEEDNSLSPGEVTQTVSGTYDSGTGNYTIKKTVSWNWC